MKLWYFLPFIILSIGSCIRGMGFFRTCRSYIKSSYKFQKAYHHTNQDLPTIERVIAQTDVLFNVVPGYHKVVERLYTSLNGFLPHTSKGSLYELQVALDFHHRGHRICAFEKIYTDERSGCMREIDIITDVCAIECKNINWQIIEHSPQLTKKIRQQIQDQHALVTAGIVGVPHYILCSKNEIPPHECNWLRNQQIFYFVYTPELVY